MNMRLLHAEQCLELAATYAGDGAVLTAIDRAEKALKLLRAEKRARIKAGLIVDDR